MDRLIHMRQRPEHVLDKAKPGGRVAGENVTRNQGAIQTWHPVGQQPAWHVCSVLSYKAGSVVKTARVAGHSITLGDSSQMI